MCVPSFPGLPAWVTIARPFRATNGARPTHTSRDNVAGVMVRDCAGNLPAGDSLHAGGALPLIQTAAVRNNVGLRMPGSSALVCWARSAIRRPRTSPVSMAQITINQLSIRFRGPTLLDEVTCQINPQQRIGLLGRNGSGKTTLLRILCGDVEPDSGEVLFAPGTRVSLLPQDVPRQIEGRVFDVVAEGLVNAPDDEHEAQWQHVRRVERVLSEMTLDGQCRFEVLSSGMKRRVLLAQALVSSPDVLLLDEPTNHLDIEAIDWLEEFLLRWSQTLMFVTHDRMFLRKLATRILEIDRGRLFDWSCDYDTFLQRKEAALAAEEKQNALFDKKLAEEEAWIRQGIKARRTRNEGRVRALEQMRRQRQANVGRPMRRCGCRSTRGSAAATWSSDAENVSFAYGDRRSCSASRPRSCAATRSASSAPTAPARRRCCGCCWASCHRSTGTVRLGTNLQIAYFDQLREQLDEQTDRPGERRRRLRHGAGRRQATTRHRLPAGLSVHTRAGPHAGPLPLRRRTQPRAAGATVRQTGQRDRAGRTDERSRHRDARTARRTAGRVPGHRAAGQPRPRVPEQRGHQHDRLRTRTASTNTSAATTTGCVYIRPRRRQRPERSRANRRRPGPYPTDPGGAMPSVA